MLISQGAKFKQFVILSLLLYLFVLDVNNFIDILFKTWTTGKTLMLHTVVRFQ